jgi:tetratricopeptide (TPR) repeat protein
MAYDKTSRNVAAAWIIELDAPPPIIVAELGEAELKTRCEKHQDPLRLQSCERLVETAATPEAKAEMLILRSRARPYEQNLADLDLAVAAAPGYAPALIARAYRHLGYFGNDSGPMDRAWADADSAVRVATPGLTDWRNAIMARVAVSHRKGNFADAVTDLTEIVETDPETIGWVAAERAAAYVMAGRPDEALADLDIVDRTPGEAEKYGGDRLPNLRALALIELGRAEEAQAVLAAWESKRPSDFSASMRDPLKARALLLSGSDRAAFDLAAKAAGPRGIGKAAIAVRGLAAARLGDALTAISDLTAIIDEVLPVPDSAEYAGLTPGFAADLFLHRGLARVQLRQINAARADFSEVIRRAPDRARAYAERARLALKADNPAALTDIAMALRIEPAEPRWLALAARINHATGDMQAAERFAAQALAANSAEPDIVLLRAKARLALGRFAEAAEDASVRLAAAPSDADALLVRIEARTGQGDLKAALVDAEAARAVNGGDPRILLALAELKARGGDAPGAIGVFEEAVAKPDAALVANRRLGDLYAGIGSDQLALGYYAKAIELPARGPGDEAAKAAARDARDGLIRKMTASK